MTSKEILQKAITDGCVEMETADDLLIIWFREFFGTSKEFHFQFNAKAIFGCKRKPTAEKKIQHFIDRGFQIVES